MTKPRILTSKELQAIFDEYEAAGVVVDDDTVQDFMLSMYTPSEALIVLGDAPQGWVDVWLNAVNESPVVDDFGAVIPADKVLNQFLREQFSGLNLLYDRVYWQSTKYTKRDLLHIKQEVLRALEHTSQFDEHTRPFAFLLFFGLSEPNEVTRYQGLDTKKALMLYTNGLRGERLYQSVTQDIDMNIWGGFDAK